MPRKLKDKAQTLPLTFRYKILSLYNFILLDNFVKFLSSNIRILELQLKVFIKCVFIYIIQGNICVTVRTTQKTNAGV